MAGEQAVTVDLPEPLCTGSSITSDDHPFIEVNIPSPTMEDQGCMTRTQGGQHDTLPTTIPKTPWKPRIALMTQVAKLLDRGMTDNYDRESEHSIMADHATQAEMPPTRKTEELLLPLETSSQTSVDGMDASVESTPVDATLVTVVHSSQSDSPIEELQLEVNLALNSLFTTKRTCRNLRGKVPLEILKLLCANSEADAMAAIEKAKAACSQRDLHTRVKCAKAIMKAKLNYRMIVQEARTARCAELQESEVA